MFLPPSPPLPPRATRQERGRLKKDEIDKETNTEEDPTKKHKERW